MIYNCDKISLSSCIESQNADSALEESPGNTSTNSSNRSEVSSLDEHRVEEDQRRRLPTEKGEVFESDDTIILEDVPIVTPNKDVVATGLTFQVDEI